MRKEGFYWIKIKGECDFEVAKWCMTGNIYSEGWFSLTSDIPNSVNENECDEIDEKQIIKQ